MNITFSRSIMSILKWEYSLRYKMLVTAATSIGTPTDGNTLDTRKNVIMGGFDIPGFGRINL